MKNMVNRGPLTTSSVAMVGIRFALFLSFIIIVGRLFQLQILEGNEFSLRADENRYELMQLPAKRGVIYDATGQILTRNRPSFEVSVIPEHLPFDDEDTPDIDERAEQITKILRLLGADQDETIAIQVANLMFLELGRSDFANTVESLGLPLSYILVPGSERTVIAEDGSVQKVTDTVLVPDVTQPLPLPALVALVQRLIFFREQGSASRPVRILDLVERLQAFAIDEESYRFPSVRVSQQPVREYVYGDLLSHVLGFMGPIPAGAKDFYTENGYTDLNEKVGLNGLEYSYQTELRGLPSFRNVEVDILGREMRTVGQLVDPVPGSNLHLSIDLRIQRTMYEALSAKMEETEAPWGVTIAMDPMNGAILGMVSLPSYDNNIFAERINEDYLALERDERRPLINYAIGGLYPPGSTYKMVTASAALHEGVVSEHTKITDAGPIFLPNKFYPNDVSLAQKFVSWNHRLGILHGPINIVDALALSNDIFFYWIGGGFPPAEFRGLGQKSMSEWTELYGYGPPTGIDLPGEVEAVIPSDQWKRQLYAESWTTGDSYNMSIGQGYVLATPLQVLVSTAAVANGGTVYAPQIVAQIVDANGGLQRDFTPRPVRTLPLNAAHMRTVQQGMWAAVNRDHGTSIESRISGLTIGAKTGTAEYCEYIPEENDCLRDEEDNLPTHAWFVAYAPYEAPEIAVVAFVYNGGEGSAAALPVVRSVFETYFREVNPILEPPPEPEETLPDEQAGENPVDSNS